MGYVPGDSYADVFGVGPDISLVAALDLNGGKFNALTRHSTAALLNAASADVSYNLTVDGIIAAVQDAYDTGDWQTLKNQLEGFNEQGCPLN